MQYENIFPLPLPGGNRPSNALKLKIDTLSKLGSRLLSTIGSSRVAEAEKRELKGEVISLKSISDSARAYTHRMREELQKIGDELKRGEYIAEATEKSLDELRRLVRLKYLSIVLDIRDVIVKTNLSDDNAVRAYQELKLDQEIEDVIDKMLRFKEEADESEKIVLQDLQRFTVKLTDQAIALRQRKYLTLFPTTEKASHGQILAGVDKVFEESLRNNGGVMIGDETDRRHKYYPRLLTEKMDELMRWNVKAIFLSDFEPGGYDREALASFAKNGDKTKLSEYFEDSYGREGMIEMLSAARDKGIEVIPIGRNPSPSWKETYQTKMSGIRRTSPDATGVIVVPLGYTSGVGQGLDAKLNLDSFDIYHSSFHERPGESAMIPGSVYFNPRRTEDVTGRMDSSTFLIVPEPR